jgi:hypothetical protein
MVLALGAEEWAGSEQQTMTSEQSQEIDLAIVQQADQLGAQLASFLDGSVLATLDGADAARRAAKLALVIREHLPDSPIVVAGGGRQLPALDDNLKALERDVLSGMFLVDDGSVKPKRPAGAIRLDDLMAAALAKDYDIRRDATGSYLVVGG